MGEADDRARLTVAIEGLRYLLSPKGADKKPVTRNQLFQTLEREQGNSHIKKALSSKGWQKIYAERMVSLGMLEKIHEGGSDMYQVTFENGLLVILKDWLDGHGELISTIVFSDSTVTVEHIAEMLERKANALFGAKEGEKGPISFKTLITPAPKEEAEQAVQQLVSATDESAGMNRGLRQEIDLIRADLIRHFKENDKAITQLVSVVNGAVRVMKEGQTETSVSSSLDQTYYAKMGEVMEDTVLKISADLDNLTHWASKAEKVISMIHDQTIHLGTVVMTHQEDKLGHAIKTMEAAMELLVDAVAEKK